MGGPPHKSITNHTFAYILCVALAAERLPVPCFTVLQLCRASMDHCSLRTAVEFVTVIPSRNSKLAMSASQWVVRHSLHSFGRSLPVRRSSVTNTSCASFARLSVKENRFSASSSLVRPSPWSLTPIFRWHCISNDDASTRGRFVSQLRVEGSRSGEKLSTVEPAEPFGSFGELLRMSTAEALGVFVIFTSGMLTAIANPGDLMTSAITSGLGVMVMVFALGQISGAHFNPAVSFAFLSKELVFMPGMRKKIVLKFLFYLVAQFLGALLAAGVTTWITGDIKAALTVPTQNWSKAFIVELILGFLLMLVATTMSTIHKRPDPVDKLEPDWWTPIFIGGTVMFNILLGGRISGASMNPFRSLAPAIWAKNYDKIWIYLVAPTVGAFLGTWIHTLLKEGSYIFRSKEEEKGGWQSEANGDQVTTS
ncbi:hypothetical protein M758_4G029000 [Ceratodon purpureus]|nr:hypothetical protein M758_4G029000 [Ceratodon purpureus]